MWKEQFDKQFPNETYDSKGTCHCWDMKQFISAEVIKELIADIPKEVTTRLDNEDEVAIELETLKQQLISKWL